MTTVFDVSSVLLCILLANCPPISDTQNTGKGRPFCSARRNSPRTCCKTGLFTRMRTSTRSPFLGGEASAPLVQSTSSLQRRREPLEVEDALPASREGSLPGPAQDDAAGESAGPPLATSPSGSSCSDISLHLSLPQLSRAVAPALATQSHRHASGEPSGIHHTRRTSTLVACRHFIHLPHTHTLSLSLPFRWSLYGGGVVHTGAEDNGFL